MTVALVMITSWSKTRLVTCYTGNAQSLRPFWLMGDFIVVVLANYSGRRHRKIEPKKLRNMRVDIFRNQEAACTVFSITIAHPLLKCCFIL